MPWLRAGRENGKNMPPSSIFLSVCVCESLHVCILYKTSSTPVFNLTQVGCFTSFMAVSAKAPLHLVLRREGVVGHLSNTCMQSVLNIQDFKHSCFQLHASWMLHKLYGCFSQSSQPFHPSVAKVTQHEMPPCIFRNCRCMQFSDLLKHRGKKMHRHQDPLFCSISKHGNVLSCR